MSGHRTCPRPVAHHRPRGGSLDLDHELRTLGQTKSEEKIPISTE